MEIAVKYWAVPAVRGLCSRCLTKFLCNHKPQSNPVM